MSIKALQLISTLLLMTACSSEQSSSTSEKETIPEEISPNIILIYTDDVGYGDVSSYGATEITTPNIDRLAEEGIQFTDAHTTSATCT
ncbi:MAG: sulfatase-like hydrolase/transferase, partial [Bacteroidota bacterium]